MADKLHSQNYKDGKMVSQMKMAYKILNPKYLWASEVLLVSLLLLNQQWR